MQITSISEPGESMLSDDDKLDEIVVGIDFGTTNSLVAISNNYKAKIIKMQNGVELVPSVITLGDSVIVGEQGNKFVRSIKRLLAKSSEEIQNNINLSILSNILNLKANNPKVAIANGRLISLPEAASEIFKYLKTQAELELNTNVQKAVVSVPAYFDDASRGQVLLAAKLAGLEVIRLIAEPTAAAYAYGLNKSTYGAYLVYDLGGGTFDVSILNMSAGVLQVVATGGDNMLGGDDIDMLLAMYIAKKMSAVVNQEIISAAKVAKEALSKVDQTQIRIGDFELVLDVENYIKIISPIIDKTIKIAKDVLYEATELEEDLELSGIILVGGSTRIPLITKRLQDEFSLAIYSDIDPDKVVALGAAMQAENLTIKSNSLLIDVVPLSVGLELYGGIAEKIIMRNTPIPFAITKEFTTHIDNQTGMQFHILQGEREMVRDCRSLARFELIDIPPMKAGKGRVEVTFVIDADGVLGVSAKEALTNKVHNISIKPSYGLNEQEINDVIHDAFRNAEKDHTERLLAETRESANSLILGLKQAILETPDVVSKNELLKVTNAISSLQKVINLDNRDGILLAEGELNKLAGGFIQKHLDKGVDLHLKGRHVDKI